MIRDQPFVDLLTFEKTNLMNPDDFWIYHRDSPVLDVRSVDENNNLVSIYDKIFFK